MSRSLILISHGHFCEELKKSTEMIMGPQRNIHTVPLLAYEGQDQFKEKFTRILKKGENYIVLADIMGGTPCNVVSKMILEGKPLELYTGMNMPMVISFINSELIGTQSDLLKNGQTNIRYVNSVLSEQG